VSSSGVLSEQPNSPYTIAAPDPISVIAVNTNPGQNTGGLFVYVGNQGPTAGALNPFQVCTVQNAICTQQDVNGSLMVPLGTCPLQSCQTPPSSAGQAPVQMLIDPTTNFLYVVSQGSNQVFGFRINASMGTLTALSPASQPTGSQPVSLALHPSVDNTGQFLYVSNSDSDNITSFSLSTTTGSMSNPETTISPAAPSGIAVH
jgi:6-phosphogluconolactonase